MRPAAKLEATLAGALGARRARLPAELDLFRWVDFEVADLTVDLFGDVAVASTYRVRPLDEERALAQALARVTPLRAVYWKRRPKEARRAANQSPDEVAPAAPLWGEPVERLVGREHGLAFEVRPANGLSVGLYLDARDARAWVQAHARGRTVLNLFAYTCGFAVAALAGGARRAVNVDASRKVLDWGEENVRLNGGQPDRRDFIAGDALEWLRRLAKKGERFSLVVADPPSFASVGKRRFVASEQYPALVAAAADCVEAGGTLLCCSNLAQWTAADFQGRVNQGLALAGRRGKPGDVFGASDVDFAQPSALKVCAVEL